MDFNEIFNLMLKVFATLVLITTSQITIRCTCPISYIKFCAYLVWSTVGCIHDLAAASCDEVNGSSLRDVTGPRGWLMFRFKLRSAPAPAATGVKPNTSPPGPVRPLDAGGYSLRPHSRSKAAAGQGDAVIRPWNSTDSRA